MPMCPSPILRKPCPTMVVIVTTMIKNRTSTFHRWDSLPRKYGKQQRQQRQNHHHDTHPPIRQINKRSMFWILCIKPCWKQNPRGPRKSLLLLLGTVATCRKPHQQQRPQLLVTTTKTIITIITTIKKHGPGPSQRYINDDFGNGSWKLVWETCNSNHHWRPTQIQQPWSSIKPIIRRLIYEKHCNKYKTLRDDVFKYMPINPKQRILLLTGRTIITTE